MDIIYQPFTGAPPPHELAWVDQILDTAPARLGALVSRALSMTRDGMDGALLTFWPAAATGPTGHSAAGAAAPVRVSAGHRYAVVEQQTGNVPAAAKFLQLTAFDGPRGPQWKAALRRSGAERVWPAVRQVPGITGTLLCEAPNGGALALTLAVSVEALESAVQAVMATDLLPGEDPALLTGPDRVEVHRLLHCALPNPEVALSASGPGS